MGAPLIVQQLLELDLIEELRLMLFPIVLGSGKRLFTDSDNASAFVTSITEVGDGIAVLTDTPVHD